MLSATEIARLCEWLVVFRDTLPISPTSRTDREKLAEIGNALADYAKHAAALDAEVSQ